MSERRLNAAPMTGSAGAARMMDMLRRMILLRRVEERIADGIERGEIGCPCHLYIGQEAVAVGVCSCLEADDLVFSTHRSHGHYLAKGGNVDAMVAEVYCRENGCSGGWGGSMHIADAAAGLPGSSAIVAGTIPLAVGAALAFRVRREARVAVVFFGDGATNEGVFYECLNLAALHRLPVLFVCENNLYSTHMPIAKCLADTDISSKAFVFGLPGERVDGNDVVAVSEAAARAVARARAGLGPTLLECLTYRWRGHVGPNFDIEKGLRSRDELEAWMQRCPIKAFERRLTHDGLAGADDIERLRGGVETLVERAFLNARQARYPSGEQVSRHASGGLRS